MLFHEYYQPLHPVSCPALIVSLEWRQPFLAAGWPTGILIQKSFASNISGAMWFRRVHWFHDFVVVLLTFESYGTRLKTDFNLYQNKNPLLVLQSIVLMLTWGIWSTTSLRTEWSSAKGAWKGAIGLLAVINSFHVYSQTSLVISWRKVVHNWWICKSSHTLSRSNATGFVNQILMDFPPTRVIFATADFD